MESWPFIIAQGGMETWSFFDVVKSQGGVLACFLAALAALLRGDVRFKREVEALKVQHERELQLVQADKSKLEAMAQQYIELLKEQTRTTKQAIDTVAKTTTSSTP